MIGNLALVAMIINANGIKNDGLQADGMELMEWEKRVWLNNYEE